VYVDRVKSVARGAGTDARRVLGLAMAHEIGHVLLNSNTHAPTGLMRANWSRNEMRRNDAAAWRFLDIEATHVRCAALERHSPVTRPATLTPLEGATQLVGN
jgi:hypothetical protein